MYTMNTILIVLAFLVVLLEGANAQYDDVRCKCVCPPQNSTIQPKKAEITIKNLQDASFCKCETVVNPPASILKEFCPRCECKWQRRNTKTIKVVVIIIICIVSLLFLYMLFLLCLDPLMSRRPRTYQEQQNEEVNMVSLKLIDADRAVPRSNLQQDTQSISPGLPETSRPRPRNIMTSVKDQVSKVRGTQEKWKGTVQEQRKNIFDRHTMLN